MSKESKYDLIVKEMNAILERLNILTKHVEEIKIKSSEILNDVNEIMKKVKSMNK